MRKLTNKQNLFLKSEISMPKNNMVPSLSHSSSKKPKEISVHSKNVKKKLIANGKTLKNQVLLNKKKYFDSFEKSVKNTQILHLHQKKGKNML